VTARSTPLTVRPAHPSELCLAMGVCVCVFVLKGGEEGCGYMIRVACFEQSSDQVCMLCNSCQMFLQCFIIHNPVFKILF
jgi:hypothetical protein